MYAAFTQPTIKRIGYALTDIWRSALYAFDYIGATMLS